jgi:hypothetical protein
VLALSSAGGDGVGGCDFRPAEPDSAAANFPIRVTLDGVVRFSAEYANL